MNVGDKIKTGKINSDLLQELRQLSIHYAKKGDLLYPHLKVKYETVAHQM